jgi:hypothetical protein
VAATIVRQALVDLSACLAVTFVTLLAGTSGARLQGLLPIGTGCMRTATAIVGLAVVNRITLGLTIPDKVSLAHARVCAWARVAAHSLSMTVVLLVGVSAWVDRLTRDFAVTNKPILACARAGAGASLGAVSVSVATTVVCVALVDLRA